MSLYARYAPVILGGGGGGGGGITSINGDTSVAQFLVVGTTGTDFAIVDNGTGTHTFNLPNASLTARGVVSTGSQIFGGNKEFDGLVSIGGVTAPSGGPWPFTVNSASNLNQAWVGPGAIGYQQWDWVVGASSMSLKNDGLFEFTMFMDNTAATAFGMSTSDNSRVDINGIPNKVTLQVYAGASGTGDLQRWDTNGGTTLAKVDVNGNITAPSFSLTGSGSGVVSILPQAAAGTYNFNLPITAGSSGQVLTSAGGIGAPMTWTSASSFAITSLTGDVTGSGPGATATSLVATTNATLTTLSALASVGTITTGTWNATTIAVAHGGTGQVTAAAAFNALSPITTTGDMIYSPSGATSQRLAIGSTGNILTVSGGVPAWAPPATSGTVTSVSVVSANGLSGTVATATSTPAITLSTSITGILQGNGTAISAATTTGSGSVVLSASPTLTGTIAASAQTWSGLATFNSTTNLPGNGTALKAPTISTAGASSHSGNFSANSTGTYTFPTSPSPLYIRIRIVGGGGGGAGSSSTGGNGGTGGTTTFGTSLLTCVGGGGGAAGAGNGGAGGSSTATAGTVIIGLAGTNGGPGGSDVTGTAFVGAGIGGSSPFGGGGPCNGNGAGFAGQTNTGSGGGGANTATLASAGSGGGGASGGYIEVIFSGSALSGLGSSVSYAVGAAGSAGTAGTGSAGGAGGAGYIIVEEFYQ